MPFIDVAGGRFNYRIDGKPEAPVLMLSNSLGTDLDMWWPQMPALTAKYRVVRYDTRGQGKSSATPGPYTIAQHGKDVLALLDALAIERANFCGLSMGGMISIWLGIHAGHRLDKLVLCNTAAKIGTAERWNARIEAVRSGGMKSIAQGVIALWFTPPFAEKHADDVARVRTMLETSPADGYIACCMAIRDMDQRARLGDISVPTLVISGTQDTVTPPTEGAFAAEHVVNGRHVELDAAHLSNIEQRDKFTTALLDFLED
jgi:3-oxoadipate enol-lactonase